MTSRPVTATCLGDRVRADFPFFAEHPGVIYLNGSAMPLRPRAVLEAIAQGFFDPRTAAAERVAAERRIADFLGVGPADVHPVMGCHMAFERIYELIFDPRRPRMLTSPLAHKAALTPLDRWQRRGWVERRPLAIDASGRTDVAALKTALEPRVRAVVVNHVSSVTGVVEPLEDLAQTIAEFNAAESTDVLLIVDGAQAVPRLPVSAGVADLYLVASQKCGGLPGGVVVAGERGRRGLAGVDDDEAALRHTEEHLRAGTPHTEAVRSLAAAFEGLESLSFDGRSGMAAVARAIGGLRDRLLDGLARLPSIQVWSGARRFNAGIVSFQHAERSASELGARLQSEGIFVRVGVRDVHDHWFCVPDLPLIYPQVRDRDGPVRVSLSFYNTPGEVDRLLAVLEELDR